MIFIKMHYKAKYNQAHFSHNKILYKDFIQLQVKQDIKTQQLIDGNFKKTFSH